MMGGSGRDSVALNRYRGMTMTSSHRSRTDSGTGLHIATITHGGRIWGTYLEFDDDPTRPDVYLARLRFDVANPTNLEEAPRTTVIIIEESYQEAVTKARDFDDRQLEALLRSALPD